MTTKNYRDLLIWQKGMDLVKAVYQLTSSFPKEEIYGLTSQLRRAAVSVPSNIAEGHSRNSDKEFNRFLNISLGSLAEVDTQLEIAKQLKYEEELKIQEIQAMGLELRKMIFGLIRKLDL